MTPKEVAVRMMDKDSFERQEAEKMMGVPFSKMTIPQRRLAASAIAAFYDAVKAKYA